MQPQIRHFNHEKNALNPPETRISNNYLPSSDDHFRSKLQSIQEHSNLSFFSITTISQEKCMQKFFIYLFIFLQHFQFKQNHFGPTRNTIQFQLINYI